jgi:nucleoside-diphosphate-sugar epimerase
MYVANLIEALVLIAETNIDIFSIVNVGGISVSIHQFADAIRSVISAATIAYKQLPEHLKHIQVGDVILDNTIAVNRFQWEPKLNLEQSVRQTVEFYQNHKDNYL